MIVFYNSLDVGPLNRAELLLAGPLAVTPAGESSRAGLLVLAVRYVAVKRGAGCVDRRTSS
jgi:hypothetical protein